MVIEWRSALWNWELEKNSTTQRGRSQLIALDGKSFCGSYWCSLHPLLSCCAFLTSSSLLSFLLSFQALCALFGLKNFEEGIRQGMIKTCFYDPVLCEYCALNGIYYYINLWEIKLIPPPCVQSPTPTTFLRSVDMGRGASGLQNPSSPREVGWCHNFPYFLSRY